MGEEIEWFCHITVMHACEVQWWGPAVDIPIFFKHEKIMKHLKQYTVLGGTNWLVRALPIGIDTAQFSTFLVCVHAQCAS